MLHRLKIVEKHTVTMRRTLKDKKETEMELLKMKDKILK